MAASSIAAFWVVSSLLIMVPGPDWAFTISAGLRGHSVVPAVGGIVLGYAAMTVAVAAGVGTLVARSPALLTALTIAGGLYLIWHGAATFARPSALGSPGSAPASTRQATLVRGAGVSALNPKGLLLFLGLVFMLSCGAFYLCLGSFARKALHARPAAAGAISRFSGAAMIVIGIFLLLDRLIA